GQFCSVVRQFPQLGRGRDADSILRSGLADQPGDRRYQHTSNRRQQWNAIRAGRHQGERQLRSSFTRARYHQRRGKVWRPGCDPGFGPRKRKRQQQWPDHFPDKNPIAASSLAALQGSNLPGVGLLQRSRPLSWLGNGFRRLHAASNRDLERYTKWRAWRHLAIGMWALRRQRW